MRRLLLLATVCALVATGAAADEKSAEQKRTIAVTGRGEVKGTPDRVSISFAVETTAGHAGEAASENAKRSTAVAAALRGVLGADATITTTRYTIEPRYEPVRPGETREPRITGYVARNEVQVEGGADKVGGCIDAAVGAGANRIGALQFSFAKQDELERAALEKAGATARAQAESVARGLGVRLKGVLTATTATPPVYRRVEAVPMMAESRAAPTPIEPGEATVSATLQVTYEIE